MHEDAIVLLAGGQERRFPGKLEHHVDGIPLLARCYERLRATGLPMYVIAKGSFSRELDARLEAPFIVDRHPGSGPLRALLDACAAIPARRMFVVAGDQPEIDTGVLERLEASWQSGDEAAVPVHDGQIEPLVAIYDRAAVLREVLRLRGRAAMRELVARLATRLVPCDGNSFHNVNHRQDLA
ncbi:MAG: molybdenum cofactor guanylyltransferase [Candidatus Eremiobacteraeota bacterium]|nr:molybdenum cofactor guanylyltransferase [Candidatus Eremiobacteraeota bacterium]